MAHVAQWQEHRVSMAGGRGFIPIPPGAEILIRFYRTVTVTDI